MKLSRLDFKSVQRVTTIIAIVVAIFTPVCAQAFNTKRTIKTPGTRNMRELDAKVKTDPSYQNYCNRADVLMVSGEADLAISDYNQALRIRPGATRPLLRRSQAYEMLGKCDRALLDCELAVRTARGEGLAEAILQKIRVLKALKRLNELPPLYEQLIASKNLGVGPQDRYNLYEERAEIYLKLRQPRKVLSDLAMCAGDTLPRVKKLDVRSGAHNAGGSKACNRRLLGRNHAWQEGAVRWTTF